VERPQGGFASPQSRLQQAIAQAQLPVRLLHVVDQPDDRGLEIGQRHVLVDPRDQHAVVLPRELTGADDPVELGAGAAHQGLPPLGLHPADEVAGELTEGTVVIVVNGDLTQREPAALCRPFAQFVAEIACGTLRNGRGELLA